MYGETFDEAQDGARLESQLVRVRNFCLEQYPTWSTLGEISAATGAPEASVSARLRNLRLPRFGEYIVTSRRTGKGARWEYRICPLVDESFQTLVRDTIEESQLVLEGLGAHDVLDGLRKRHE